MEESIGRYSRKRTRGSSRRCVVLGSFRWTRCLFGIGYIMVMALDCTDDDQDPKPKLTRRTSSRLTST